MNKTRALERLKSKGYKYTDKREDILVYFEKENGYRSARDLLENMRKRYTGISFDTIYRNLHLFVDLGILEATILEGEKHFRIKCDSKHHHHFICLQCGDTREIRTCPMMYVEKELEDFSIEDHKFEIYGTCSTCKSA
ncbi:transcriptional repressor [Pontibacillus yanchengensis]|uniref:Transcriptional repressor n=2 Tax=Pontibacillus yanchengensis TaxID=462910 RepID=A0ACC7VIZ2_9BACI|nr:Fur family transcriptional regulator [Pontibacillus yanchengensis]MYL33694.1 transcriptional repressor [Pontibacillus yanchengensis]MYL55408.1 transcriptional repressor [Pontibacillus yanchengensis]